MSFALTVGLAVAIGVSLGLLGGGGSILAVPLLVYVAGLPVKEAIAASLFAVGVTSAVAVLPHARAGRVRWPIAMVFGLGGVTGAYGGGLLARYIPAGILLTAFALMMLVTATAMIRGRRTPESRQASDAVPVSRVVGQGVAVGLVTGLVGAGGGFLVVPALVLLGGLPMSAAVGTSLVVIAMNAFAGLAGVLSHVSIDWPLAGAVTAAALLGSVLGTRLAGRIHENLLRRAFGWFVIVMGGLVLAQQLPADVWTDWRFWVATTGVTVIGIAVAPAWRSRRRTARGITRQSHTPAGSATPAAPDTPGVWR
jgi:uncharacterized membrane protein YfcA